jgi:hypothetical protein
MDDLRDLLDRRMGDIGKNSEPDDVVNELHLLLDDFHWQRSHDASRRYGVSSIE